MTNVVFPVAAADGPLDNPLKGWASYCNPDDKHCLPVTMAYFYRSWRELQPEPNRFAWEEWEREWNNPVAKGKHVVLRVYLDYPTLRSGVPDWVRAKGVRMTPYTDYGGGLSPDYNDPRLRDPLLEFIAAFGKRYNRNPRVAFIALGTLGFWGEWHTFPRGELFASEETQARVVEAYHRAFPDKRLMARYAGNAVTGKLPWIGYHDDLIPEDTDNGQDWGFLPAMRKAGRTENWRVAPIGGEMYPGQASKWLGPEWATTQHAINAAHMTWIGPYCPALEPNPTPEFLRRGEAMVRQLGYEYRLRSAVLRDADSRRPTLQIEGENRGIAPFYYPWPVEVALLDGGNNVRQRLAVPDADLRRWQPGPFSFSVPLPLAGRPDPSLWLALGIRDPWTDAPRIRFANSFKVVNGWSILGPLRAAG